MVSNSEDFTEMKLMNDTRALLPAEAVSALLTQGRDLTFRSDLYGDGKASTSINNAPAVESQFSAEGEYDTLRATDGKGYTMTFTDKNPTSQQVRSSVARYGLDSTDPSQNTSKFKEDTTILDEAGNIQMEILECQAKKLDTHKFEVNCQGQHFNTKAELQYNFKSKSMVDNSRAQSETVIEFSDPANLYLGKIEQKVALDVPGQKLVVTGKATPANNTK